MAMKLSNEILDAAKETGNSVRRKNKLIKWLMLIKHLHILDIK